MPRDHRDEKTGITDRARSMILVSSKLATALWEEIPIQVTLDITAVKVTCKKDQYFIITNTYNPHDSINALTKQLHKLMHIYRICPKWTKTIEPTQRAPWSASSLEVHIDKREAVVEYARNETKKYAMYTDGLGYKGCAETAVVMFKGSNKLDKLTYHLGTLEEHTVHGA
jgi:hypothetical protein